MDVGEHHAQCANYVAFEGFAHDLVHRVLELSIEGIRDEGIGNGFVNDELVDEIGSCDQEFCADADANGRRQDEGWF